jgi:hypothetical protein
MRFFSLTQFVDFCIDKKPTLQSLQVSLNTKKAGTVNRYNQQQVTPALIKWDKDETMTYTQFVDTHLAGEDFSLSFKMPAKWPQKWMAILIDTEKKTSPTFEGHYYAKTFRKMNDEAVIKAEAAQKEIKSLDEIRLDDIALSF